MNDDKAAPTPSLRDDLARALWVTKQGHLPRVDWKSYLEDADIVLAVLIHRGIICEHGETRPHPFHIRGCPGDSDRARCTCLIPECFGPALPKEAR